jgi:aconitase B
MELYQKYLSGKKMESGTSVWDLYEQKNYAAIEARCTEEIDDALFIYKSMFDLKKEQDASLNRLKRLDKKLEGESVNE